MATRILVVDDVDYIREGLILMLSEAGYEVTTAANGVEALTAYAVQRPDVVLLDLDMPVLDGWATLPRLLAQDPSARVIIHSGFISADEHVRLLAAGAVGTLVKKLDPETLVAALVQALAHTA